MFKRPLPALLYLATTMLVITPSALKAQAPASAPASAPVPARQLGTVQSVSGSTVAGGNVTLLTAAGVTVTVPIAPDAPVLQLPPGSTDLKSAQLSSLSNIAVGDRISTGKTGDTVTASRVILMKSTDIAAHKATQQADWQSHGTGGIVRAIDGSTLEVSAGSRSLKVITLPATLFRRYADDSVKFEAAKPGTLAQIRPGDQLRVRGARSDSASPAHSSITADEVITGTFDNLAGALTAIDPAVGTITLEDITSKKPVTVRVTANSDLRKLSPEASASLSPHTRPAASSAPSVPDPSQVLTDMLAKLPAITLADLHPGDSVLIVATQDHTANSSSDFLTAISLLSGVQGILSATPSGARPVTLSPWNLGSPDAGTPQ